MRMPLPACLNDLGSVLRVLEASWEAPQPSLPLPPFLICPLTVSSLNLINLSESALGKCDTEFGVIAECAGRRGCGVVGGTKTLAWGQADVLGCL